MAVDTQVLTSASAAGRRRDWSRVLPRIAAAVPLVLLVLLLPAHNDTFGHVAAYAAIFVMVGLSMNVLTG